MNEFQLSGKRGMSVFSLDIFKMFHSTQSRCIKQNDAENRLRSNLYRKNVDSYN